MFCVVLKVSATSCAVFKVGIIFCEVSVMCVIVEGSVSFCVLLEVSVMCNCRGVCADGDAGALQGAVGARGVPAAALAAAGRAVRAAQALDCCLPRGLPQDRGSAQRPQEDIQSYQKQR